MHPDPTQLSAPIIQHLKRHGQQLDSEIAEATGISLKRVRACLKDLFLRGEISQCHVTRFSDSKPEERILCRIAGSIPQCTPGRKPGARN